METVIDFVIENYIAFAIGGAVILLAIIGFIGEKMKKKKNKSEAVVEEVAKPIEVAPETPIVTEGAASTESLFGSEAATEKTQYNLYGSPSEQPQVDDNMFGTPTPTENTFQYNGYEPQNLGTQQPVETPAVSEDLFAPISTPTPTVEMPATEPVAPVVETTPVFETPVINEPVMPTVEMPTMEQIVPTVEMPVVEPTVEPTIPTIEMPTVEPVAESLNAEMPKPEETENRF